MTINQISSLNYAIGRLEGIAEALKILGDESPVRDAILNTSNILLDMLEEEECGTKK